jgi:two-component system phosphate regulon sensor histidine kinase PhoR
MTSFGLRQRLAGAALVASPAAGLALAGLWSDGLSTVQAVVGGLAAAALTALLAGRWLNEAALVCDYLGRLAAGRKPVPPPLATVPAREAALVLSRIHDAMEAESRSHIALAASYETTLDSVPDPLFLLNEQRRVVGANTAARGLLERDHVGSLMRVPAVLDAVDRTLAGEVVDTVEFSLPLPSPRTFLVRCRRLPVEGVHGARLVVAVHDISAIRRSEHMRAEFVANASHELRTPLASLLGYIETLAGPARDDAAARERFLPVMHQVAGRMASLIDDLLMLSRIEFDEHTRPTDAVDLAAVVRSVVAALHPQAEGRGMTLRIAVEDDVPVVLGQRDQLAQVAQNLADNAIKYGREGTSVDIRLTHEDDQVVLRVADQGEGIAPEHIPRLTERFFRCDAGRSRAMGGTGLGLAIVKHIVNRHRGVLTIESTLGRGSAFTVTLPAINERTSAP